MQAGTAIEVPPLLVYSGATLQSSLIKLSNSLYAEYFGHAAIILLLDSDKEINNEDILLGI